MKKSFNNYSFRNLNWLDGTFLKEYMIIHNIRKEMLSLIIHHSTNTYSLKSKFHKVGMKKQKRYANSFDTTMLISLELEYQHYIVT